MIQSSDAIVVAINGCKHVAGAGLTFIDAAAAIVIAVMVYLAIENLVANPSVDVDAGFRAAPGDFKPIDNVVSARNVEARGAIGGVLTVDNGLASDLRPEDNRARGGAAGAQMDPPARRVVGIEIGRASCRERGEISVGA